LRGELVSHVPARGILHDRNDLSLSAALTTKRNAYQAPRLWMIGQ